MDATLSTVEGGPLDGFLELTVTGVASLFDILAQRQEMPFIQVVSFDKASKVPELAVYLLNLSGVVTRYYIDDSVEHLDQLPRYFTECKSVRYTTKRIEWRPVQATEYVFETTLPCTAVPVVLNNAAWKIARITKKPKKPTDYIDILQAFPDWRISGPGIPRVRL